MYTSSNVRNGLRTLQWPQRLHRPKVSATAIFTDLADLQLGIHNAAVPGTAGEYFGCEALLKR